MSKRYYNSARHTIQVDWLDFMDELAEQVGVKPNLVKYFFTDRELWKALMFNPAVPYQYRLEGIALIVHFHDTLSPNKILKGWV